MKNVLSRRETANSSYENSRWKTIMEFECAVLFIPSFLRSFDFTIIVITLPEVSLKYNTITALVKVPGTEVTERV